MNHSGSTQLDKCSSCARYGIYRASFFVNELEIPLTFQMPSPKRSTKLIKSGRVFSLKDHSSHKGSLERADIWNRAHACRKYVGAHVSAAGGCQNAIVNAQWIGYV